MINPEVQKELLKQTVEPRHALELAINMELGMRNQHQIQQLNKTLIPASVNAIQFPNNPRSSNWFFSNNFQKPTNRLHLYCSNRGGNWLANHRNKCIAKGKNCNNCRLKNHFARVCRKQKNIELQNTKKRTVNTVDEELQPKDTVNFLQLVKLYKSDYSSGEDNTVALIQNGIAKMKPLNTPIKIGSIPTTLPVDSIRACSALNRSLASQGVKSSPRAFWIHEKFCAQLRTFSNEPIHIERKGTGSDYKQRLELKFGHFHRRY